MYHQNMNIFGASPSPTKGNTLFYSQVGGTLQAVKLSERCYTMPVTHRDRGDEIQGYVYHNRVPEFLYQAQWVAVPYDGGTVERRINVKSLVAAIPRQIIIIRQNDSYDACYKFGATLNQLFGFGQTSTPTAAPEAAMMAESVPPTDVDALHASLGRSLGSDAPGGYIIRMNVPLQPEDCDRFMTEFRDTLGRQMGIKFVATIEPKTAANWKY